MDSFNILLTCAGRRHYLVSYFKQAITMADLKGKVICTDANLYTAAMANADLAIQVPPVDSPQYIPQLVDICSNNSINILISLNDLDLPYISANQDLFKSVGTHPIISNDKIIHTCFDKWLTYTWCRQNNIKTPETVTNLSSAREKLEKGEFHFPLIIKPRWGSGSIAIETAHSDDDLNLYFEYTHRRVKTSILGKTSEQDRSNSVLIQQKIIGQELGVDILNDLSGKHVQTNIKIKHAMRAGETDRAETVESDSISSLCRQISKCLSHIGNLDCDIFQTPEGPYLLEMNPRFGGGYPFSHVAGANYPLEIISWFRTINKTKWTTAANLGVLSCKYDNLVELGPLEIVHP